MKRDEGCTKNTENCWYRGKSDMKLRIKIISLFLILGLIPLVISLVLTYEFEYNSLIDKTEEQLIGEASQRGNALVQINEMRIEQMKSFADTNEVQDLVHTYDETISNKTTDSNILNEQRDETRTEFTKFQDATDKQRGFFSITIIDKKGIVIFSSDESLLGKNFSQNKAFANGLEKASRSLVSYNNKRAAQVVTPIYDKNKDHQITGVAIGYTSTRFTDNILLNREGLGQTGESYLVDFDKTLLTPSRFMKGTFQQRVDTLPVRECIEHGISINQEYFQNIRNPENMQHIQGKGGIIYGDYRGIPVLGASYCIPELGQVLLVEMDKKEALSSLEVFGNIFFITGIILACCVAGTAFFVTNRISNPIVKLGKMVKNITLDKYDTTVKISSDDEIGNLARQFEKMRQRVAFVTKELQILTERQAAEIKQATEKIEKDNQELERSVNELAKIKNAIDRGTIMAITDPGGIITQANEKFCQISKYSKEELIGQNHRILKSGYHPPSFYKDMWKTISSGNVWVGEIKNKAKDDSFYWVTTIIVPQMENGRVVEYLSFRVDITKEKELQERLAKAEHFATIGELSARIAHDIRNPLSVIQNTIEIWMKQDKEFAAKYKDSVDRIKRANARIAHQIEDVLDYVRPRPLILREESICKIITQAIDKIKIPEGIVIDTLNDDIYITCDSEKIEIVFVNLVMNAIQAIGTSGDITIRCIDEGENVSVRITDTGHGISEESLSKIFDPLFTTKQVGTGLGLVSCKNIIERHGGKIEVKSKEGRGATFTIILPKKQKSNPDNIQ